MLIGIEQLVFNQDYSLTKILPAYFYKEFLLCKICVRVKKKIFIATDRAVNQSFIPYKRRKILYFIIYNLLVFCVT